MALLLPFARVQHRSLAPKTARTGLLGAGAVSLMVAMTSLPALAQDAPPPPAPDAHAMPHKALAVLTVAGQGDATVQPDLAQIAVGVSTQADTAGQALSDNAEKQTAVIEQLKSEGIEARDIQTSGLNLSPVQDYSQDGKPPVITGYMAQNMVTVRVRDLAKLGEILDKLVSSGANEINSVSFSREDATEAEDAARIAAIKAAERRAQIMADAAGQKLGPLMSLSDTATFDGSPRPMRAMAAERARASTPIEMGELSFSANVTATYALLPKDE